LIHINKSICKVTIPFQFCHCGLSAILLVHPSKSAGIKERFPTGGNDSGSNLAYVLLGYLNGHLDV